MRPRRRTMKTRQRLSAKDQGRETTLEELLQAECAEGMKYEIIDGRLEVSPLPAFAHEDIVGWLAGLLEAYARACPEIVNRVMAPVRVFVPGARRVTAPEPD